MPKPMFSPNSTFAIADPVERLVRRATVSVSNINRVESTVTEIARLRSIAAERAEVGNVAGQNSANQFADKKHKVLAKFIAERTLLEAELSALESLVALAKVSA